MFIIDKAIMAKSSVWLICLSALFLGYGVLELEASHHVFRHLQTFDSTPSNQPYRTSFHFQPPKNWMNDPNGPLIYKGIYHLFYQYNPYGAVWGNIVWAHSTSTDLINWVPHNPAIYPSQPSNINGCWSGSTTILPGGKPVILYTGINPQNQQVQNLAMSKNVSDPYLLEWVKSSQNPLMAPTPTNKINASWFRDPTMGWLGPDGRWRVIVGSKRRHRGMAILYRSKDFIHWTKAQHPLHSAKDTGMWECPDFYPVSSDSMNGVDTSMLGSSIKHVLKASLDDTNHEYYTIGTYNYEKDIYTPEKGYVDSNLGLRYDYGKFYASKTFFDSAKNRRVLWGWINESTSLAIDKIKGWSGVQAIPRKIWLDKSGKQLMQWPIAEIEELRKNQVDMSSRVLKGGSVVEVSGVTGTQADVEIVFEIPKVDKVELLDPSWTNPQLLCSQKGASVGGEVGPFGLMVLASEGLQEFTAVFFRIFKDQNKKFVVLMCSDQSRSSSQLDYDKTTYGSFVDVDPVKGELSLRSLGDSYTLRGYGNVAARDWYAALPDAVRQIVDQAGFGAFCRGLSRLSTCRPLLATLAERWWDTTDSFHLSVAGDMTMTPHDFTMLTGIGTGGDPIPFDMDMAEWTAAQIYLLGEAPPQARPGFVRYSWFEVQFRVQPVLEEEVPMTEAATEQYARGFLMFLLGTTLFADRGNTVPLYLLSALVDVRDLLRFDWGGAALATLYGYMSSVSRGSGQLLGGYWRAWELWAYAYFPRLEPVPERETPLVVPFSRRYDGPCSRRPRDTFSFFRRFFDTVASSEIVWQPWAPLPAVIRERYAGATETSRYRILLEGPICRAWYLGERFLRQTLGLPEQIVPVHPPEHMRDTERFSHQEMADYTLGWDESGYRGEGDYSEYIQTFLMRPLSRGSRADPAGSAAPAARAEAGVRAGSSRRARARGRRGAQRGRGTGWPALPTMLTYRGQGGETYQIPFAPPPAGHELAGIPELPPASSEYTRQSVELNASLMGMLQRTLDALAAYSLPPPFPIPPAGGAAPAGPPLSTRDGRVFPRTKRGRDPVGSSSRAPVPGDGESETEAEASEEEAGSGSGSDSDSDASGGSFKLMPRKRARMDPPARGH